MIDYKNMLNDEQYNICIDQSDLLVKACPGSGKTRTIIYKLAHNVELNPYSVRKLVAITYTNRAAEEINERIEALGIDTERIWAGTIHQFCLEWILRRFKVYKSSLSRGFTIADERKKQRYLEEIIQLSGQRFYWEDIKTGYTRELKLIETDKTKRAIIKKYHQVLVENTELDFELILALSHSILQDSPLAAQYIKDAIEMICIDEYQDTQDLQYAIIEDISNADSKNHIQINFFGDPNQAIYGTLGGIAKTLDEINDEFNFNDFKERSLIGCYRSTQRIVDFYSPFMVEPYDIVARGKVKNEKGVICYQKDILFSEIYDEIAKIIILNIKQGVKEKDICVLAPSWWLLYPFSSELQSRLPDIKFDAPDITPIKRDPMNLFYNISRLLLTEPNVKKFGYRRKIAADIISKINGEVNFNAITLTELDFLNLVNNSKQINDKGSLFIINSIKCLFETMKLNIEEYENLKIQYEDFIEKMNYRLGEPRFCLVDNIDTFIKMFKEKEGILISTCHSVKGEEYETVIAFGLLFGKLPNIKIAKNKRDEEAKKLLYVIASRAKKNIYFFSEKGRTYRENWDTYDCYPTKQLFYNKNVIYDN